MTKRMKQGLLAVNLSGGGADVWIAIPAVKALAA